MNRPDVLRLFQRQHGVAHGRQLGELGVSHAAMSRAVRRGSVDRPYPGVFSIPGTTLSFEGQVLALQLLAGPGAFVSGLTAGRLHGLRGMPTHPIEVTIHETRRAAIPPPHRLHLTSWIDAARDTQRRPDGLVVASPLRTLFGLASRVNQHRFERIAEDIWHKGLVTPQQAGDYLQVVRRSGNNGVAAMERWLQLTARRKRPSQSGLELDFVDLIERVGLPTPKRQFPLTLSSGEEIHIDLAWPDVRLGVEPGASFWHLGVYGQRKDQGRDRACAVIGWLIIRYDEDAARDPVATARELLALYRRRAADLVRPGSSEGS